MARRPLPSQETLLQLFSYDPESGRLFWKERPPHMFPCGKRTATHSASVWNQKYAGKAVGSITKCGYYTTSISDVSYLVHRLIWKLNLNSEPDILDHINGRRTDNRLSNLRIVTSVENARNCGSNRKHGHRGVRQLRGHVPSWQARICVGGKDIYLGSFPDHEKAVAARLRAETDYGFHPNHGRSLIK